MSSSTLRRASALLLGIGIGSFGWLMSAGLAPVFAQGPTIQKDDLAKIAKAARSSGNQSEELPHVDLESAMRGEFRITTPKIKSTLQRLSSEHFLPRKTQYHAFREHNVAMEAIQPSWMGPLIQSDARLGQAIRISVSDAAFSGEQTLNYGNNHGVSFIVERRFQVDLDPPSFFRNHSNVHKDGFGNAGTQVKWRIASGNAEHGNYAVSALVYHAFAPRIEQNQMLTSFYIPAVVAGRGFGRFTLMTEVGGILPTGKIAQQGRGIEWDVTAQVQPSARIWVEVEDNALLNYAGPFDGKTQNFLTPAAFYMIRRKAWKQDHAALVAGGGMQIATSSFHFYNHNLISELRVIF